MRLETQRNLGLGLMVGGALAMAGALLVAGHARLSIPADPLGAENDLLLMHEAWGVVGAAALALMAGTLVLESYRRRAT
jgi:hypothetical protein